MIAPNRIRYNNLFSNELNIPDLIMCVAMDSDNGETPSFLNRDAVSSESYDGRYKRIHNFKYTQTFSPQFTFFKKDFSNFEMDEVRIVLKWLTSKDTTALLEIYYDDSDVVSWASIGGFVEPQLYKLANNRTIAITATWDSISPFAFSDLYTVTKTISDPADNKITINIDTDDNKPVYPRISIRQTGDGIVRIATGTTLNFLSDIVENTVYYNGTTYYWKSFATEGTKRISATRPNYAGWTEVDVDTADDVEYEANIIYYNMADSRYYWLDPYAFHEDTTNPNLSTTSVRFINSHTDLFSQTHGPFKAAIKNNTLDEKIVFDCANQILSSSRTNRIFDEDFIDLTWLPLYDGKNEITVEGNCEVKFEYRTPIKCGEY